MEPSGMGHPQLVGSKGGEVLADLEMQIPGGNDRKKGKGEGGPATKTVGSLGGVRRSRFERQICAIECKLLIPFIYLEDI
jgi:hypothetical protein